MRFAYKSHFLIQEHMYRWRSGQLQLYLYLRTELRYRDHKDGIRKLVKNHYETVFSHFLVQVKIEVTTGQKVNFE